MRRRCGRGSVPHPPSRSPAHSGPSPFRLPGAPRRPERGPRTDVRSPTERGSLCACPAGLHAALGLCGERGRESMRAGHSPSVLGRLQGGGPTTRYGVESEALPGWEPPQGPQLPSFLALTPSLPIYKFRAGPHPAGPGQLALPAPGRRMESGKGVGPVDPGHPRRGLGPIPGLLWRRTKTGFVGEKNTRSWGGFWA